MVRQLPGYCPHSKPIYMSHRVTSDSIPQHSGQNVVSSTLVRMPEIQFAAREGYRLAAVTRKEQFVPEQRHIIS